MLFDVDAVAQVMEWALPAVAPNAVWAQTSTVGLEGTERLAALAAQHDVAFVDAPVLGTKGPAEQGTLTVLASGPTSLREAVTPVFDAIGSKTIWVGDQPGEGHKLKLVANSWIGSIITGVAQAVALAEALGLDPQLFPDTIAGGPLDMPYAQLKSKSMIEGEFPSSFAVSGVLKDTRLIAAAIRSAGVRSDVVDAVEEAFRTTEAAGHGDEDMAAVVHAFRPAGS
jgi:3-hydroxyisobutyrate dehydrogenase